MKIRETKSGRRQLVGDDGTVFLSESSFAQDLWFGDETALTKEKVATLIRYLQQWLESGRLPEA